MKCLQLLNVYNLSNLSVETFALTIAKLLQNTNLCLLSCAFSVTMPPSFCKNLASGKHFLVTPSIVETNIFVSHLIGSLKVPYLFLAQRCS